MLPTPSDEQEHIIKAVAAGHNVVVDAVAGSGKTTTILLLAKAHPSKRIAVITYNARLKAETRAKAKRFGLQNVEVHSYHSFGRRFYKDPCITDTDLQSILQNGVRPFFPINADILILDEAQDMTKLYYDFIKKVRADTINQAHQLIVLGDNMQCIYDFPQKGADPRFLTLASKIYDSPNPWLTLHLRQSYRITKPMERFVNEVMLGYPRIHTEKASLQPVRYIMGDTFQDIPTYIANQIRDFLSSGLYRPDDIFILAPSIRSVNQENPIKRLENILVRAGAPCFVPISDDEELRDEIIEGKVVFSSFHQSKGLERKVVFVASFNTAFYFTFKDASKDICPNILYVAATRAMERLYLWGEDGNKQQALPFLRQPVLLFNPLASKFYEKINVTFRKRRNQSSDSDTTNRSREGEDGMVLLRRVTDLTRFLPEETMRAILEMCEIKTTRVPYTAITIASEIVTRDGKKENVSDLNGIAIPTIYEHRLTDAISIQNDLQTYFMNTLRGSDKLDATRKAWIATIQTDPKTPAQYLKLANIYSAYVSGYLYKMAQIQDYTWLEQDTIEDLLQVLVDSFKEESEMTNFEHTLSLLGYEWGTKTLQIEGRADFVDDDTLWELKCVDSLKGEHLVQLAMYAWLWQKTEFENHGSRRFRLLNIRTGEIQEITNVGNLDAVVGMILDNHFRMADKVADDEFVERCFKAGEYPVVAGRPVAAAAPCLMLDD